MSSALRAVQRLLNSVLARCDLELIRRTGRGRQLGRDLQRACTNPETIFDVGANIGQTYLQLRQLFPKARIYSFEPSPDSFNKLREVMKGDKLASAWPYALGEKIGEASFTEYPESTANSLLPATVTSDSPAWLLQGKPRLVEQTTVAAFCEQHTIGRVDILKIDTQGFDGRVIAGAAKMLDGVSTVTCEVNLDSLYEGQATFEQLFASLTACGFRLVDLYGKVRAVDGLTLSYADALFARDHSISSKIR